MNKIVQPVAWREPERQAWLPEPEKDRLIRELRARLRVLGAHVAAARCLLESCGLPEEGGPDGQATG
jgi:hypothetical protein